MDVNDSPSGYLFFYAGNSIVSALNYAKSITNSPDI